MSNKRIRVYGGEEKLYPHSGIMYLKGTITKIKTIGDGAMIIKFSVQDKDGNIYPPLHTVLSGIISQNTLIKEFWESTDFSDTETSDCFTEPELQDKLYGNNALLEVDAGYYPPLIKSVECPCLLEEYGYEQNKAVPYDL